METNNFYHGVTKCSHRKICSEFFTQIFWVFWCIFWAPLSRSLSSKYHILQKLVMLISVKGDNVQGLSWLVMGSTGVNELAGLETVAEGISKNSK